MKRRERCGRVGELFIVGLPGPSLDARTRDFAASFRPGGFILFERNAGADARALGELCESLHGLWGPLPPLIAIDQEGGRVSRLVPPLTRFPSPALIGRAGSPALAERAAHCLGAELRAVGIDIDFAPVLDVLTRPRNPVIGDRAFSSVPEVVARVGGAFILGLREAGIIACGKHFPGHGHTAADSHVELPRVDKSYDELVACDLVPFRRAVSLAAPVLMSAHVLYPALDPHRPATLSRPVLTDLLRGRFRYRGLVVTDDLEMGAIANLGSVAEAAVQALSAGADMLLVCHSWEQATEAKAACERAVFDGAISAERVEAAYARIAALKRNHFEKKLVGAPPLSIVGCPAHHEVCREIETRASPPPA
jgi:beta-N-acetylhexosaminidase